MGRWLETHCGWCRCTIAYLPEWSHIPEYCKSCNEWQLKTCANPHCGGTVKYKCYWNNIRDYCDCNGWYEATCENNKCFQKFNVNCNWDNPPKYCSTCRGWQEKPCDSPKCNGIVRYKAYWDNIPDYCSCKGWYDEDCKNSHCNGKVRVHASWNNPPQYCSCKGWYKVKCDAACGMEIDINCSWKHIPTTCETCKKTRNVNGDQQSEAENYKRLRGLYPALRDREYAREFHQYLAKNYVRGIDKPISFDELYTAYLDFIS